MYLSHRPGKSRYIFYAKIVSQPNLLSGAIWDRIIMGIRANVSIKHGTYCLMWNNYYAKVNQLNM